MTAAGIRRVGLPVGVVAIALLSGVMLGEQGNARLAFFGLIAAGAVAAIGLQRPKLLVALALFATMFDNFLALVLHSHALLYSDDGLAAACILLLPAVRVLRGQALRGMP